MYISKEENQQFLCQNGFIVSIGFMDVSVLVTDRVPKTQVLEVLWRNGFKKASWSMICFIFCQTFGKTWRKALFNLTFKNPFFGWLQVSDPSLVNIVPTLKCTCYWLYINNGKICSKSPKWCTGSLWLSIDLFFMYNISVSYTHLTLPTILLV